MVVTKGTVSTEKMNLGPSKLELCEAHSQEIAKVEGYSEIFLDADVIEFILTLQMIRTAAEDVKLSVSKRVDYIIYILNKLKVKGEEAIQTHQILTRIGSDFRLTQEIHVKCSNLKIYEEVANKLTEKLGESVSISSPRLKHSTKSLQEAREKCVLLSVENARRKASRMARVSGQEVGDALYLEEKESRQEIHPYGREPCSEIYPECIYKFVSRVVAVYALVKVSEKL